MKVTGVRLPTHRIKRLAVSDNFLTKEGVISVTDPKLRGSLGVQLWKIWTILTFFFQILAVICIFFFFKIS